MEDSVMRDAVLLSNVRRRPSSHGHAVKRALLLFFLCLWFCLFNRPVAATPRGRPRLKICTLYF